MADLRLFVAVLLEDSMKKKIARVEEDFRKAASDVKWVDPENFHVTLKFLGNVSEDRLDDISEALASAVEGFEPFTLSIAGSGAFPGLNRPQVVWIGIGEGKDTTGKLARSVETELEAVGFPKEDRPFKGHITIGRIKNARDVGGLPGVLKVHDADEFGSQRVDRIALMQSDLRREGPKYSAIREFELPGRDEGRDS